MMRDETLIALILVFVPFSLISIGGGSAIIAAIQHEAVTARQWITGPQFIEIFAVSRAAPGPGTMLATLIGWKVGGWTGATVATLALYLPSSLLAFMVFRASNVHRGTRWYRIAREGLAPVGSGLVLAGVIAIFRLSGGGVIALGITFASACVMLAMPRLPVLLILAAGGAISIAAAGCR